LAAVSRRARIAASAAILCGLALAAGLAVVVLTGLRLSQPARAVVGPPPADMAAEVVALESGNGARIAAWFRPGLPGGGVVLLLHGVRANRLALVGRARMLAEAGFGVFLLDFQAHGESSGRRITFGARESADAAAAVGWLRRRLPGERIGVIGISLGGAAALLGPEPLPVQALVLEAVYPDIGAAIGSRLRANLPDLPAWVVKQLFVGLMWPVIGVAPGALRPIDRIGGVGVPVLVVAGTEDDRTPLRESQALFARAAEPKSFWAVPGARHVDLAAYAPDAYREVVLGFLAGTLL